jgi:hypothetical protein
LRAKLDRGDVNRSYIPDGDDPEKAWSDDPDFKPKPKTKIPKQGT